MLVSKQDHCLADLLQRHKRDELHIDIPVIISNHDACAGWAELFKIPFTVYPVTKETSAPASLHRSDVQSSISITLSCRRSSAPIPIGRPMTGA